MRAIPGVLHGFTGAAAQGVKKIVRDHGTHQTVYSRDEI